MGGGSQTKFHNNITRHKFARTQPSISTYNSNPLTARLNGIQRPRLANASILIGVSNSDFFSEIFAILCLPNNRIDLIIINLQNTNDTPIPPSPFTLFKTQRQKVKYPIFVHMCLHKNNMNAFKTVSHK